jgi:uncharacterized membrane protein YgcG
MAMTSKTNRDLKLEKNAQISAASKKLAAIESLDSKAQTLLGQFVIVDKKFITDKAALDALINTKGDSTKIANQTATVELDKTNRASLLSQLNAAQKQSSELKSQLKQTAATKVSTASKKVTAKAAGAYGSIGSGAAGDLSYNASAVYEAYFSSNTPFVKGVPNQRANPQKIGVQSPVNKPTPTAEAKQLWTSANGSKGMIVTSEQVLKAWNSGSNKPATSNYFDNHNYGFQFQYNPGTVSMSYYTSPNVDVTMITSGTEMFNLAGVSGSQGSVSFQIVINRVLDMQYYDPNTEMLKSGYSGDGVYPVPPKTDVDYKALYNKGTMYDVEYLLRVLMGTTMESYLRGEQTADMGWLPAIPVELHLGKSLRYLGTINNVNLNHIMFDSRMVPIFTTMDIGFARLPDYPPNSSSSGSSGSGGSTGGGFSGGGGGGGGGGGV